MTSSFLYTIRERVDPYNQDHTGPRKARAGTVQVTAVDRGWQTLTLRLFRRIRADLVECLTDADPHVLNRRIAPGANSAGWLAWHIARGQD